MEVSGAGHDKGIRRGPQTDTKTLLTGIDSDMRLNEVEYCGFLVIFQRVKYGIVYLLSWTWQAQP